MKRNLYTIIFAVIMLMVGVSCSDKDGDGTTLDSSETVVNVDIIMPENMQSQYKNIIDWALQNMTLAQQGLDKKIRLSLRYHDEDKENLDILGKQLTSNDNTSHAVIGPFNDYNAKILLGYLANKNIPVMLPTYTNPELQRIYSRSKNIWFLSESTTTQCEIMLHCIKQLDGEASSSALVYSNDTIGKSYLSYFGRFATELKVGVLPKGICAYQEGGNADFSNLLQHIQEYSYARVCLALSKANDTKTVIDSLYKANKYIHIPFLNITEGNRTVLKEMAHPTFVITPLYSPKSGFAISYYTKFKAYPLFGEAQIYDALSIIALGAAKRLGAKDQTNLYVRNEKVTPPAGEDIPALNDWMRATVANDSGDETNWNATGLTIGFRNFSKGEVCNVTGATGTLDFDVYSGTNILNTYYGWLYFDGKSSSPALIEYLTTSTQEGGSAISTTSTWQWDLLEKQVFDPNGVDYIAQLTPCTDYWALLITPSTKWSNYRHQADVFAIYQLLRSRGYSDDHIITINEDNLATCSKNAGYEGKIYIEKNGKDVRSGCKVDYHFSDLTRDDIKDIMLGNSSTRLPKVFNTTHSSNIFVFWSGHGGAIDGPLWGDDDAKYSFGTERIKQIVSQMNEERKYRRMMMVVETCYSGLWGKALEGIDNLVVLTSANDIESSHADGYDDNRYIFYRNAFTKTFYDELSVTSANELTLLDFYKKLAKSTKDSHAGLYNESHYGSVYTNYLYDFFPQ